MQLLSKWTLRRALPLCALLFLIYAGYVFIQTRTGNFYEILPGELYRSGQLTSAQLQKAIDSYGLRTVYNLRGAYPGQPWYDEEKATLEKAGVKLVDFKMNAKQALSTERAHELMDSLKAAEKPILVHCKAGADRTGLAVALYMAGVAEKGEEASEAQLSFRFGHIPLPFLGEFNMDQTFENLESFFNYVGS